MVGETQAVVADQGPNPLVQPGEILLWLRNNPHRARPGRATVRMRAMLRHGRAGYRGRTGCRWDGGFRGGWGEVGRRLLLRPAVRLTGLRHPGGSNGFSG